MRFHQKTLELIGHPDLPLDVARCPPAKRTGATERYRSSGRAGPRCN